MKRALVALALGAAALLPVTPSSAANGVIQPGDYMVAGASACTTNFVYDGTGSKAGKVYIGTAAHCVTNVGQDVSDGNGLVWGDVAVIGNANSTSADYALIEVRAAYLGIVSARVKGLNDYPTGVTTAPETNLGDLIQISGHGLGFGASRTTQERRVGVLMSDSATTHSVVGPLIFGDSGGPLVHIPTGKAWGIVSRLCTGTCTETGPTVQNVIALAGSAGFTVALRTV